MRVHGDKAITRRLGIELTHYQDAKEILEKDFHYLCGYCGKNQKIMRKKFHIDHFVPKAIDTNRENDYYNLVLACPKCNLSKSNKWPTNNPELSNDGNCGFVDPATKEYDTHLSRNEEGYIEGLTPVGKSMCQMLHFDLRRTDIFWNIERIYVLQDKLEELHSKGKLNEQEKDFYIEINKWLKKYIDAAFVMGE